MRLSLYGESAAAHVNAAAEDYSVLEFDCDEDDSDDEIGLCDAGDDEIGLGANSMRMQRRNPRRPRRRQNFWDERQLYEDVIEYDDEEDTDDGGGGPLRGARRSLLNHQQRPSPEDIGKKDDFKRQIFLRKENFFPSAVS